MTKFFYATEHEPRSPLAHALNFIGAFLLITCVFFFSFHHVTYQWGLGPVWVYRQNFIHGWLVTILFSLCALAASTCIGLIFALARRSRILALRYFARIYVEVIRGTPLLVQILIFFYVVAEAFSIRDRY